MLVGTGAGAGLTPRSLGQIGGEENHTLSIPELPYHNHPAVGAASASTGQYVVVGSRDGSFDTGGSGNASKVGTNAYVGSNQPHNNMPPFMVVNFMIKT